MKKQRIHIDMDHCAVDFELGKQKWLTEFPDEKYPHSHLEFWINLEPMPGFLDALKQLEEMYDVFLLTAPSLRNRACWTGKSIWVFNHLGAKYLEKLIISYDKSQFSGTYLIDDGNQNGQDKYNGQHIRFAHSEQFSNWDKVVSYIQESSKLNVDDSILLPEDAHAFIEDKLRHMNTENVFHMKKDLEDVMKWAFQYMRYSSPPQQQNRLGHNYAPPFYGEK